MCRHHTDRPDATRSRDDDTVGDRGNREGCGVSVFVEHRADRLFLGRVHLVDQIKIAGDFTAARVDDERDPLDGRIGHAALPRLLDVGVAGSIVPRLEFEVVQQDALDRDGQRTVLDLVWLDLRVP